MSVDRHILGIFRWPLVLLLAVAGGFVLLRIYPIPDSLESMDKAVRMAVYFVGGLLVGLILTTEGFIRFLFALIGAVVAGAMTYGLALMVFKAFAWKADAIPWITGGVALLSLIGFFQALCHSSWIGERCPSCTTRGTLSEYQSDKQFLGSFSKHENGTYKTYNKYMVTTTHSCSSCSHSWDSSQETSEVA